MRGAIINREDENRRRSSKTKKIKDVEKQKSQRKKFKFSKSKIFLILVISGAFFKLLYYPSVHLPSNFIYGSNFLDRSINIANDIGNRYFSNVDINWDHVRIVTNKFLNNDDRVIALVNFNADEIEEWSKLLPKQEQIVLGLDFVSENVTWETLYPEWIEEEEQYSVPKCPTLPDIQISKNLRFLFIAVKLPCSKSTGWSRDVTRLHLQLATARLVASGSYAVHVLFVTDCFPIPNLFTCKDLVLREGNVWLYEPNISKLRQKVRLPVGSCELSVRLEDKEQWDSDNPKREAYATILHSVNKYVCGAITTAQSIRMSGSARDLIILVDDTITPDHREGLESAGWKIRTIERIRNPKAKKKAYNEFNYSKFRLWQLTDYDKIIFIDSDLLILRNIDKLFRWPEISATGNDATLFNSGVMVIQPSNCTFNLLMERVDEIESYNGGDQGYLNEIFTWWHRIPKHMNYLKHFWEGDDEEVKKVKTKLFSFNPPVLYVLHYLGLKPWLCFRDYDCNWNVNDQHVYASDAAHRKWWSVHDKMPKKLHKLCALSTHRKAALEWDGRKAEIENYRDEHWKIKIRDKRLMICSEKFCLWKKMLRHWGEKKRVNRTSNHVSTRNFLSSLN